MEGIMNQILYGKDNNIKIQKKTVKNYSLKYKLIFYFALLMTIFFIVIFFIRYFQNIQNEEISKKLTDSYFISTLYANNTNYTTTRVQDYEEPFVIRNNKNR